MIWFTLYDELTGEVRQHGNAADAAEAQMQADVNGMPFIISETRILDLKGARVVDGQVVFTPKIEDLAEARDEAVRRVDREAEQTRSLFITPGAGQAMVYTEKRREAEIFLADPETPLASLPHLKSESELNGISPFDQAVQYITMAHQWTMASALIETIRLGTKTAIGKAETLAAVNGITADWTPATDLITLA